MESRHDSPDAFIVATAIHPLKHGCEPGEEFKTHLQAAAARAQELAEQGQHVAIYVPGSRHTYKGEADKVPLSIAGVEFLKSLNLNEDLIALCGDNLNHRYKGDEGVYNGGDEAFVAANFYKDNQNFGQFEVFCSLGQQERWRLQAIANGVLPNLHTVIPKSGKMFHAKRGDKLDPTISYTKYFDPTWQSPDSFLGQLTRQQRRP